ncbi:MAG: YceI family protein [Hyphomonadaceae bacterium]|nr:YceI family protein [Hyphomonadaceae bacterium]
MRSLIFAAVAFFAAGAAHAEPVTYALDPAHTQVAFSIDRFGFNRVLGQFDTVEGQLILDEANPANSSVRATVQIASVSSGNATRDEHLRGARWFNAEQFATMSFESTSVRLISDTRAEVTGNLTLLGQTHPLVLDVTLNRIADSPNNNRRTAGFSATGTLDRTQWGLATAAGMIGNNVTISIEALAQVPAAAN